VGRDQPVPIVGVVKDVLYYALDNTPPPTVFVPIDDSIGDVYSVTYVLQVNGSSAALAAAIDTAVHAESPQAVIADASLMRDRLMRSIRDRSFATLIVCFFAIAAIGVSAAGIVGVVGSVVARRTREIAIRVALGADRTDVRWLVTAEAALASAIGAVAGFTVAAWLSKTLSSLLFGVSPSDPMAMALAAGLLVGFVAAAAWWPARRAVRLSPTEALRIE
jgi:ABC-type antimicrobial peptide transport system permease subunit